jgi:DNA-binding transcriptional LysR family regulator
MELRQLNYFISLADELHFGRAARRQRVGQPTLSLQLARLEAELGVRLVDRTSRRVELTDAGRAILDHARLAVRHAEYARQTARLVATGLRGHLHVVYAAAADSSEAVEMISSFRVAHPEVRLELRVDYDSQVVSQVRSGAADAGIVWLPLDASRDLMVQVLFTERVLAVINRSHPLAREPVVTGAMISRQPLVIPPKELVPSMWALVAGQLSACAEGFLYAVHEEPSQAAIVRAVRRDGLVSLVPACVASSLTFDDIVFRPCYQPLLGLKLGLIWRRDDESTALHALLRHVQPPPGDAAWPSPPADEGGAGQRLA